MIAPLVLETTVLFLGLCLLLFEAFVPTPTRRGFAWMAIAGLTVLLVLSFYTKTTDQYGGFYVADGLGLFFKQLILLSTIVVLIMSVEYAPVVRRLVPAQSPGAGLGEFYALPVFACAGLMWMASAADFIMIFVSLELVTITFYILVSFLRRSRPSLEAGTKYLILGALSTGILVYGITWVFGVTGETNLAAIGNAAALTTAKNQTALLFGVVLILIGLGFKIAAAPFQFWVADVYQGAPTPVTAFLSVGSKAAGFIVLLRFLAVILPVPFIGERVTVGLTILAFCTLIYGNFAALPQTNLKRLMAYSSIAHAGYLLIAVVSLSQFSANAQQAIAFYLGGYLVMTLLGFLVLILASNQFEGDDIAHFNGLAKRSPFLAFAMLVSMMSLAGAPFTAGFFGKFMIFKVAMEAHLYWLVGVGVISVGCGFYYYLKVVKAMYWNAPINDAKLSFPISPLARATIYASIVAVFYLGVFPEPVLHLLAK